MRNLESELYSNFIHEFFNTIESTFQRSTYNKNIICKITLNLSFWFSVLPQRKNVYKKSCFHLLNGLKEIVT